VLLINPGNGALVRCSSANFVPSGVSRSQFFNACLKKAGERGYVSMEKMTLEQRAELQRRGFVSFEALTAEERIQAERRGMLPRRELSLPP
jgi:hypothetical protein